VPSSTVSPARTRRMIISAICRPFPTAPAWWELLLVTRSFLLGSASTGSHPACAAGVVGRVLIHVALGDLTLGRMAVTVSREGKRSIEQVMRKSQLCLRAVVAVWCIYFLVFGALVTATVVSRGVFVENVLGRMFITLLLGCICSTLLLVAFLGGNPSSGIEGAPGSESSPPSQGGAPPRPPFAGKPVPVKPSPRHHLIAAKDLPPSEKTHCFPKDQAA